jgi:hypothetical protein
MLWILALVFFCWCAFREIRSSIVAPPGYDFPTPVTKPYLAVVLTGAVLCGWPPIHTWHFERFLSEKATELADNHHATVHCNTVTDTMFDTEMLAAGHASPATGKIAFQSPWCDTLMSYLSHPGRASANELFSLTMFTHESMHVRGEMNEAKTECQAVQRNYRAAKLLGVPDAIAKKNALDYYHNGYQDRADSGILSGGYYSKECAPGKAWDEHLSDSTWATQSN